MHNLMRSKKIILVCLFFSVMFYGFAQYNISVPLEDPVYNMLDYAMLRNYCETMHNARPYTLKTVLDLLNQMAEKESVPLKEKKIVFETIQRLKPKTPEDNADKFYKQGIYAWQSGTAIPVRINIGTSWESNFNMNLNAPNLSTTHWFDLSIKGDIGNNFSYNVAGGMGFMKIDLAESASGKPDSHAPNTFTQNWDGYQYRMSNLAEFDGLSNDPAAGIRLSPEFGIRLWDGKAGINFSRIRRDWGTGDGNLTLSKTARPFIALDFYLRPFPWISLSALTGSLEYFRSDGIKVSAANFQNNISGLMAEFLIKNIVYFGFNSTAIWVKRFEPGYLNPAMIPFIYQNMIGDFDNLQFGLFFGINIREHARVYYNLFLDEAVLTASDFFHQAGASMLAYQFGSKIAIPDTDFINVVLQYTKIEPYTYTHPLTEVPGYSEKMNTNYINHGEPLGYKLKPNSDEIKIGLNTTPFWYLNIQALYTLVHHGVDYGSGIVHGSSYNERMVYGVGASNAKPGEVYYKDFLKDGVYEWIHSAGVSADLDLRFVKQIPLKLRVGYTLSYTHHTEFIDGSFKKARSSEYKNRFGNYISLSVKVY